jgi:hypothetical protein
MLDPAAGHLTQLAVGLALGSVAALACFWAGSWRRQRPPAVAGLVLGVAAGAGFALVGALAHPGMPWPLLAVLTAAVAVALAAFDRRWRRLGLLPALLAVTAAGVWATVPDVEAALVLLGAAIPMTLLGWPLTGRMPGRPGPAFGVAGSVAVAAALVWAIASGGADRPGSLVGGLACLGLLAVEPALRRLDRQRRSPLDHLERRPGLAWLALAAQLALVAVAARVVGRPHPAAPALGLAALELGLAAVAAAVITSHRPRDGRTTP